MQDDRLLDVQESHKGLLLPLLDGHDGLLEYEGTVHGAPALDEAAFEWMESGGTGGYNQQA